MCAGRLEAGDFKMRGQGIEYRSSNEEFEVWLQGDGEDRCSGEAGEFGDRDSSDVNGDERDEKTVLWSVEVMQGGGRNFAAVHRSGRAAVSALRRAGGSVRASEGGGMGSPLRHGRSAVTGGHRSIGGAQAILVARPGWWSSASPAPPHDILGHAQSPRPVSQYRTSTVEGSRGRLFRAESIRGHGTLNTQHRSPWSTGADQQDCLVSEDSEEESGSPHRLRERAAPARSGLKSPQQLRKPQSGI